MGMFDYRPVRPLRDEEDPAPAPAPVAPPAPEPDYIPRPQMPAQLDPALIRDALDRASKFAIVKQAVGTHAPNWFEVSRGKGQTQIATPGLDAVQAQQNEPLQTAQADLAHRNAMADVLNKWQAANGKMKFDAEKNENAAAVKMLLAQLADSTRQRGQDKTVEAAKVRAAGDTIGLSPKAEEMMARKFKSSGGDLPSMGMGKGGARVKARIIERAAAMDPNADLTTNKATNRADSGSLAAQQRLLDSAEGWEATGKANLDNLLGIAQKLRDTGSPWINEPVRKFYEKGAGDPNQAAFKTAHAAVVNEYAKILSGASGSAGVTDAARKEADSMLPLDATWEQLQAAAKVLDTDAGNRIGAMRKQTGAIKERISGKPAQAGKKVVKTQVNKATGKKRDVYDDGTTSDPY